MVSKIVAIFRTCGCQFRAHFLRHGALQQIAFHQLADDVLGIRGAAAIATGQHLSAAAVAITQNIECSLDICTTNIQSRIRKNKLINSFHASLKCSSARSKKSALPKLPDFKTSILDGSFSDTQDGKPG